MKSSEPLLTLVLPLEPIKQISIISPKEIVIRVLNNDSEYKCSLKVMDRDLNLAYLEKGWEKAVANFGIKGNNAIYLWVFRKDRK